MKTRMFLAQLVLLALCGTVALAQEKAESKNLFKEYESKFGSPGPEQKFMEPLAGHFKATVRLWMDPNEAPKVHDGELVRKALFDGRFMVTEFECSMKDGEKPFRGIGLLGFDRAHKKWQSVWMDSKDTAIKECFGTYDESKKTWTFTHEGTCPITGKPLKERAVLRIVNDNEQQLDKFVQLGTEKEFKVLEVTLKREQKASGQ